MYLNPIAIMFWIISAGVGYLATSSLYWAVAFMVASVTISLTLTLIEDL